MSDSDESASDGGNEQPSWSEDSFGNRYDVVQYWCSQPDLLNRQPLLFDRGDILGDRNANGVPVRRPNGELMDNPFPEDRYSWTGYAMAPAGADLAKVAEPGAIVGAVYNIMLYTDPSAAYLFLMIGLGANVGQGGAFDYQREGSWLLGYTQHRQFRDVSNINVGLFAQQAGLTREETLSISGAFARTFSGNAKPSEPYSLDPRTRYFIERGYEMGASGAFDSGVRVP
jgi:hypothetical protein